jgi:hypothetical protein
MSNSSEKDLFQDWLGAYLDGELRGERAAWIEEHLAGCPDCRKELERLAALSALLHADPQPQAGPAFLGQVLQHLPDPSERPELPSLLRAGLVYGPVAIFAAWAFFQAVGWALGSLFALVEVVPGARMELSSLLPFLGDLGGLPARGFLSQALSWLGMNDLLSTLAAPWFNVLLFLEIFVSACLAVLFLAWLAATISQRRLRAEQ